LPTTNFIQGFKMKKEYVIGFLAGVAAIWAMKNLPVVAPVTAPILAKVGI
jgi:hypothetical protein